MRNKNTLQKKTMIYKKKTYTPENIFIWKYRTGHQLIPYNKISVVRSVCGVVSIGVGVATWFIPFTTIPLIALGSFLLGYDSKVIINNMVYKGRLIIDWLYCNRTPKRIIKTIKLRFFAW